MSAVPRAGVATVRVPPTLAGADASWVAVALSSRFPDATVEGADVEELEHGTNARARVRVSYSSGTGPSSVFVKGPGPRGNRLALLALGALFTEARLVRSGALLPVPHPDFYAAGVDRRRLAAVVVMEDVTAAGGAPNDGTAALAVTDVVAGLSGLARLHAASWPRRRAAPPGFLRPWVLGPGWSAVSVASLVRGLRRLDRLGPLGARPRGVTARALGAQYRASTVLASSEPRTLLHGDPHPGNTYGLAGGGVGFLDWQLARTGHWSHDVGYFLVASLSVEDRRRHERELLAGYLGELRASGAEATGWEGAWARYRSTPAFGLATWLHTLSFGTFQRPEVCLATIERFAAAYDDLETRRCFGAQGR